MRLTDIYLDTSGRTLMRQRRSCRFRLADGGPSTTLKGPMQAQSTVTSHRNGSERCIRAY